MPYIGTAYRVYYAALNYTAGLTDVRYYVYKPSGVRLGPYLMAQVNAVVGAGIYYDDFLDADVEGNYLFIADSPSNPRQHEKSVYFDSRSSLEDGIAGAVWDKAKAEHTDSGSFGEEVQTHALSSEVSAVDAKIDTISIDVELIKQMTTGRWKIDTALNQMIFYEDDNSTEIMRFDLTDENALPSTEDVYERTKV